jgi:hypothetical protein
LPLRNRLALPVHGRKQRISSQIRIISTVWTGNPPADFGTDMVQLQTG